MTEIKYQPTRVWEEPELPVGGAPLHQPWVEQHRAVVSTFGSLLGTPGTHLPNLELLAVIDVLMERLLHSIARESRAETPEAVRRIADASHSWREAVEFWGWLSAYKLDRDR